MSTFFAATGRFAVRFRWVVVVAWVAATVLANLFLPSLTTVIKQNSTSALPARQPQPASRPAGRPVPEPGRDAGPGRHRPQPRHAHQHGHHRHSAAGGRPGQGQRRAAGPGSRRQPRRPCGATAGPGRHQPRHPGPRPASRREPAPCHPGQRPARRAGRSPSRPGGRPGRRQPDLPAIGQPGPGPVHPAHRGAAARRLPLAPGAAADARPRCTRHPARRAGDRRGEPGRPEGVLAHPDHAAHPDPRRRHRLRPVPRLPGQGGTARRAARPTTRSPAPCPGSGESITFSAATVIAALLTLLLATFGLYASLGAPLAIAIALMLLAGLTLPASPAGHLRPGRVLAVAHGPGHRTPRLVGAHGRPYRHPPGRDARPRRAAFGLLALAAIGYRPAGFGGTPAAPAGSDSAAGNALLAAHFPAASSNPTSVLLRFPASVWSDPAHAHRGAAPARRASPSSAA